MCMHDPFVLKKNNKSRCSKKASMILKLVLASKAMETAARFDVDQIGKVRTFDWFVC